MTVLMLHSVGIENSNWNYNYLSVSLEQFDFFCSYLKSNGFQTLLLEDWYRLQDNPQEQKENFVFLTFDDGYLDNWIYAYPILKKYGLRGTVFVNPEFVDPSQEIRPNLESVDYNYKKLNKTKGFLNWNELKKINNDGILDVQSHTMSHNWYFKSNKIIDFFDGKNRKYDWMAWLFKPERKPFYMNEDQLSFIPLGYPVFEYDRAIGIKRYLPPENLYDFIKSKIPTETNNFFRKAEDVEKLKKECTYFLEENPGRFETDEEREKRYFYELAESKKILENKLSKKVDFLCWPGGGYDELSIEISRKAGYKATTLGSRHRDLKVNNSGFYKRIRRYGSSSVMVINGKKYFVKSKAHLVNSFLAQRGNMFYKNLNRFKKYYYRFIKN